MKNMHLAIVAISLILVLCSLKLMLFRDSDGVSRAGDYQSLRTLVQDNDIAKLKALACRGVELNSVDEWGYNLIFDARTPEMVRVLAAFKVDVNQQGNEKTNRQAFLHIAIIGSNISPDVVEALIQAGASLSVKDRFGKTPAGYAAEFAAAYPDCENYRIKLKIINTAMP